MNNDVVYQLTRKEYITSFVNSNLRIDRREHKEKRGIKYEFGILDSQPLSATSILGDNKIISVLCKELQEKDNSPYSTEYDIPNNFSIVLDNEDSNFKNFSKRNFENFAYKLFE